MRPSRVLLLALVPFVCVALAGCQSSIDPIEPLDSGGAADGPLESVDLGTTPPACGSCGARAVCMNGACVALPDSCPCPKESYCNLVANTCEIGCLADTNCANERICDAASRQCHLGCRTDPACKTGQICDKDACRTGCRSDTACAAGQICDATLCRVGCRLDTNCPMNQYCDAGALTCKPGCTADTGCKTGEICDNLRCHAGCRSDAACTTGQICESMKCRTGCRVDLDCGANSMCVKSMLTCTACTADPDRGKTTTVSTSGRSVSQSLTRYLCGTSEVVRVTWNQGPPNPGYYSHSDLITIIGATATAVTTVKLSISGFVKTITITGNASQSIHDDSYDFYCGVTGMCAGWTHDLEVSSTSDSPVKLDFGFFVSKTR